MRKIAQILGLVLVAAAVGVADPITPGTIAYSYVIPESVQTVQATDGGGEIVVPPPGPTDFPQFDPSLGTLLFVSVHYDEETFLEYTAGSVNGSGGLGSSGNGGLFLAGLFYDDPFWDGNLCNEAPPNGSNTCRSSIGSTFPFEQNLPALFAAMIGTGSVEWSSGISLTAGFSGVSATLTTSGDVTLTYFYIPEPGTASLMLLGFGVLVFAAWRRRRSV